RQADTDRLIAANKGRGTATSHSSAMRSSAHARNRWQAVSRDRPLYLVLPAALFVLSACATMHAYPGTERTPEEVATVVDTFGLIIFAGWSINVDSIDGQHVSELYGTFKVLPGTHTI